MKRIKKKLIGIMPILLRIMGIFIRIDPKLILFSSFNGRGYSCNPRAIFEEMRDNPKYEDYTLVYGMNDDSMDIVGAKVVKMRSFRYFYFVCKSKYWIFNSKMPMYMHKRKNQIYFQTWHGTPLKHLAHDIKNEHQTYYRSELSYNQMLKTYDVDISKWDYLLVSSAYMIGCYETAFQYDSRKMIKAQYPRNKVLMEEVDTNALKNKMNIPLDKKVILYAPTYRDDSYATNGYSFNLRVDFDEWFSRLGEEYVVLFKPHYLIANSVEIPSHLANFVYTLNANHEINDYYVISDILVTDYSSVFFDYALLNRPIYFYMYDIDNYRDILRGFYLNVYKDLPNKIIKHEDVLLDSICNNDFNPIELETFNERFNPKEFEEDISKIIDKFLEKDISANN